ncbi:glycosyltransferase [Anaeromyxobacter sp. SG64]|uniref:glycosyltransferase n=1 Tax=Anaeromyxobacter sp. SG64 TaxID=2925409 RepID=UPI001F5764EA|nr:glycosyltransferase [Anaeromyxobacter sp. SG64]
MLIPPRNVAIYANRFPRLYRVPTILGMARGYKKLGMKFLLAVDRDQPINTSVDRLREMVPVEQFRTFALRAVQGYRSRWFNVLASPGFFLRCLALRPKVVIQEGVGGWSALSPVLRLLFGTRIVVSYERTETSEIRASALKRHYQSLYLRWFVDKIVANGSRTVRLLTVGLGYRGKISVGNLLPYVPRKSRFAASRRDSDKFICSPPGDASTREHRTVHVLIVMVMIERKGVDRLVRILKGLAGAPTIRWTIIGTGTQVSTVLAVGSPNVNHIAHVPPHEVYDYYRGADYLLLPTREDNWSLVVHEAMACGMVPITTIENGVVPDLVDSLSGHVLDFDSPFIVGDVHAILQRGALTPEAREAQKARARRIGTHLRIASNFVLSAEE